jgi:hypothetical protein
MILRVAEGTQVVADRVYAGGEEFEVPKGYDEEATRWLALGYVSEVKGRKRKAT